MNYSKKPLSIEEQIIKLEKRGLNFSDKTIAAHYLQNISYYRLRAFTFPFQNNQDPETDHVFLRDDIDFNDIIDLYVFDRRLRNLVFNELEKIEVAVRTQLSLVYSVSSQDAVWYMDIQQYGNTPDDTFTRLQEDIEDDVYRSNEDFIKHYYFKYDSPTMPPSWMSLEVLSFGTLSRMYKLLKRSADKKKVAHAFGIGDIEVFANWLHAFSNLRNCCAHHSRIWNRRFVVQLKLPYNTSRPFMTRPTLTTVKQNKLFALLSAIKYMVDIISPGNSFKNKLKELLEDNHRLLTLKDMGFPLEWEELPVWKM
jgi:abortive infection bacteriophage resistance protein